MIEAAKASPNHLVVCPKYFDQDLDEERWICGQDVVQLVRVLLVAHP